ncbi:DUF4192 domain-containing protein [Corynebacterium alimapuense]|nr:DUF4192 domain-containing protein [Corynebacterium alimapuense]
MTTSTTPLHRPGQLIANLPGILGFYPDDSVIFAAFRATGHRNRHQLGPVMRIDFDDLHVLPEVAASLDRDNHGLVFCFVVTERQGEDVEAVIDELFAVAEVGLIPIRACWATRRILTGEKIRLLFGPDSTSSTNGIAPSPSGQWADDVVAPVSQAQSMGPLLAQGELPDLNRDESFENFARWNPAVSGGHADELSEFAQRQAREIERSARSKPSVVEQPPEWASVLGIVADLRLMLEEINDEELTVADLMANQEILTTTATIMAGVLLRDAVIEDLIEQPRPAARLMLATARTFGGEIRANALCCYSLAALENNLSMRAMPALMAAQQECPGHSFSVLLLETCRVGAFPQLLTAVQRGSQLVRQTHGIGNANDDAAAA